ncbi:hypothetical protein MILUP08_40015 [Micromonospora lupini str. Lupac 08]|uniref:Uncharacterized protein n=1 Tax=Micromonospora lupini str. Lupac 08 TaxID=1150864 RepID=I0LE88_9ACTN|nr:hypothetical protein MILUP08_40015 [Micromonospora lupini str. Lupac 08]
MPETTMASTPAANGPPNAMPYSANPSRLRATVGMAVPTAKASNASSDTSATLPTVIARSRGTNSPAGAGTGVAVRIDMHRACDLNPHSCQQVVTRLSSGFLERLPDAAYQSRQVLVRQDVPGGDHQGERPFDHLQRCQHAEPGVVGDLVRWWHRHLAQHRQLEPPAIHPNVLVCAVEVSRQGAQLRPPRVR